MRKYRKVLIVTGCAVLAMTVAVLLGRDREPYYRGRSLSKWLDVYCENVMTQHAPESTEARQAIQAIGTNAVPFMLKWIRQEPPSWGKSAYKKLPERVQDTAAGKFVMYGPGYERGFDAMNGFGALGTNGASAVPELVALMRSTNLAATRAITALAGIGAPAFPHLIAALSNTNQVARPYIASLICVVAPYVGTNACLPALGAALQDTDPAVRASAARAMKWLSPGTSTNATAQ